MTRTGFTQNYMLSVRGGSDFGRYSISYNHSDDKGIFLGNQHRQDIARMKVNASKYIFDFEANLAFKYTKSEQPQYQIKEMYGISPLVPIYNENNEYSFGLTNFDGLPNNRNVMADNHYRNSEARYYHTTANAAITVRFTPWLNFKTSYAYRGEHERDKYHTPPYVADVRAKTEYPYNEETTAYWEEQLCENVLSFNKEFGLHSVQAVAGASIMRRKYTWNTVGVEGKTTTYKVENGELVIGEAPGGFLDPSFDTIGAGDGGTFSGDGSRWDYRRVSYFGRVNYNFDNRYLVQATVRRDGSSKFGSENRWGTFPSVALGWRLSNESFFPQDTPISNLKLRASWGRLGNENALGYYDFLALISTYNNKYQGYVQGNGDNAWTGSIARALENRSLKWETTDTKNVGIDYGLFNNHLNGSINWYYNKTEDLLITKVLPPSAGLTSPILNVGKMRNTGVEIEVNYQDSKAGWDYNFGLNLATTSNKVLELSDANQVLYGEGLKFGTEHFPTQTMVGRPIGSFYLYKTDGLFQSDEEARGYVNAKGEKLQPYADAGDVKFVDVNGDGVINDADKVECGSGIPKLEVNLNFSVAWKGFDLSGVLGSAWGHKLYNGNKYFYESMNAGSNFLTSTLDAWTPTNTATSVPRAIFNDPNGNLKESDRFLENGNFVRLRQIQLGYTIPANLTRKAYIENVRFYFAADNLFTITGYKGVDPEFSRANVLNTGIDKLIYPSPGRLRSARKSPSNPQQHIKTRIDMKSKIMIPALLLMAASFSSCEDYLTVESPDQLTSSSFWRDRSDAEAGLAAAYSQLEYYIDTWEFAEVKWPVEAFREDVVTIGSDVPNYPNWMELYNFSYTNGNSQFSSYWSNNYRGLSFSNQVVQKVAEIPDDKIEASVRDQIVNEARFLRAYYHTKLLLNWEKIVVRDHFITNQADLSAPLSERDAAWDFIIQDLEAATALPVSHDADHLAGPQRARRMHISDWLA